MLNPFEESAGTDATDLELVERARGGDRGALDELVRRHQAWIYNIALRMVWDPSDAEDVTQEVLIKAITKLGTFEGRSRFRTWLYRIAVNHMLNMKRRRLESEAMSFSDYGAALDRAPDLDLPDPRSVPVDLPVLVEEAMIGCTMGMLLCLDRRQRIIFTLGEVFQTTDTVGAEILDMTPENFRQCLSRARRDLYNFMNEKCGLVNERNPCRCARKTRAFIQAGYVDPDRIRFVPSRVQKVREAALATCRTVESIADGAYREIYRDHPFLEVREEADLLKRVLDGPELRAALELGEGKTDA